MVVQRHRFTCEPNDHRRWTLHIVILRQQKIKKKKSWDQVLKVKWEYDTLSSKSTYRLGAKVSVIFTLQYYNNIPILKYLLHHSITKFPHQIHEGKSWFSGSGSFRSDQIKRYISKIFLFDLYQIWMNLDRKIRISLQLVSELGF